MDPSQTSTAAAGDIVSFDNEALIIVDAQDRILGHGTKAELHQGAGTLHRAFSIFLFNDAGDVLLQQRSADKPLWPGYWSNTCCSHPRRGESYGIATRRRLMEELGVEAPLWFTHRFRYQAQFNNDGAEHELMLGTVIIELRLIAKAVSEPEWCFNTQFLHQASSRRNAIRLAPAWMATAGV